MAERRRTRRTAADREFAEERPPTEDELEPGDDEFEPADDELEPADDELDAADDEAAPADDETGEDEDQVAAAESAANGRGRGRRRARHRDRSALTAGEAARAALQQILELTEKSPEGITDIERTEDGGWSIGVEVIEDRRIPSSTDILATYRTTIDAEGELMSYRRVRRYARGRGDSSEGS